MQEPFVLPIKENNYIEGMAFKTCQDSKTCRTALSPLRWLGLLAGPE